MIWGGFLGRLGALIDAYRSLSIIGMCKNAGKTTVFNQLLRELNENNEVFAITSIGRDGESSDIVTGTKKPGIYVRENTLIATTTQLLKWCDITKEILAATGISTPLGEVIILRALSDGNIQLAGPSINEQLITVSEMFRHFGAARVLIDGAISRKTLCSRKVTEATILCTGASYNKDIRTVVAHTAYFCEILNASSLEHQVVADIFKELSGNLSFKAILAREDGEILKVALMSELASVLYKKENAAFKYIFINGALSDAALKPLLMSNVPMKGRSIVTADSSKILLSAPIYEKIAIKGARLCVLEQTNLAAVTINPFSAYGYDFDKDEFMALMQESVNIPVINVEDQNVYD